MAIKTAKKVIPKGERLGWTPIKDAKHVVMSSVAFKGKRVVGANVRNNNNDNNTSSTSLLIP